MMNLSRSLGVFLLIGSMVIETMEAQETSRHTVRSRQKRFIYFNTQTPVNIGFLITIPLSFALPTFNLRTSRRLRRGTDDVDEDVAFKFNMTAEDILPSGSYDEPAYFQELNKMGTYFNVLEIDEDICQQRVLCEIFTDADKHRPISDLFMKKLAGDRGVVKEIATNRYFRYMQAMHDGIATGDMRKCQKLYNRCPYSSQDRIHLQALKFWTFLTSMLGMEFRDE